MTSFHATDTSMSGYERVKLEARGRWESIICGLYPEFAPAFAILGTSRIPCPMHGSGKGAKGDGFRFYPDAHDTGGGICNTCGGAANGIDLIALIEGCKPHEALAKLEHHLGLQKEHSSSAHAHPRPARPSARPALDPEEMRKRDQLLTRIWTESRPFDQLGTDHPARLYLRQRGIVSDDYLDAQTSLRFHPGLYYGSPKEKGQTTPGLVALFHRADGRASGLHRTYLDPRLPQKAAVMEPKKALRRLDGTLNGGIVLQGAAPMTAHVQLCEGLENGLSIGMATARPIICCTTAQLLDNWTPLPGTRCVTVWADADPAGMNHAGNLKARLNAVGITCRLILPTGHKASGAVRDWNDILLDEGVSALREAYAGSSSLAVYA